jgi:hypothetical protein
LTRKEFSKFIQQIDRNSALSDAAFLAVYEVPPDEPADERGVRLEELQDRAEKAGISAGDFNAWYPACEERYLNDPESFHTKPQGAVLLTKSAKELMSEDIPPIRFIVDGLLPQGLAILASPPKYGKSWMCLDLCVSVASGSSFLGHTTEQSGCLYLALEDSDRRLQTRLRAVLCGAQVPDGFDYSTTAAMIGNGLIEQLQNYVDQHPGTGLIIIDTLQKVRMGVQGRESAYGADYREIGELKTFADKNNLCVLLIHHLRKAQRNESADPYERISGTNGIAGAADTMLVLTKERNDEHDVILHAKSRDTDETETVMHFDKATYRWKPLGEADEIRAEREREAYERDPIVATIKKLVTQGGGHWSGSAKDLMDAGQIFFRRQIAPSERKLSSNLNELYPKLTQYDGISHNYVKFKRQHHFDCFTASIEVIQTAI